MPLHQRTPAKAGAKHDRLKADLVSELKNPSPMGQPVILEDRTPETKSIRVHVIWDRWEDCARELRWGIVADAYGEAFGKETQQQITLALGLTVPEAVGIGLLPFQIVPTRRKGERPTKAEYRKAMIDAGASVLGVGDDPQLRFATLEDAEKTLDHLRQTLPDSKWIVLQEVPESTSSVTSTVYPSYPPDL